MKQRRSRIGRQLTTTFCWSSLFLLKRSIVRHNHSLRLLFESFRKGDIVKQLGGLFQHFPASAHRTRFARPEVNVTPAAIASFGSLSLPPIGMAVILESGSPLSLRDSIHDGYANPNVSRDVSLRRPEFQHTTCVFSLFWGDSFAHVSTPQGLHVSTPDTRRGESQTQAEVYGRTFLRQ